MLVTLRAKPIELIILDVFKVELLGRDYIYVIVEFKVYKTYELYYEVWLFTFVWLFAELYDY